jgi:hypothetical protein
VSASADDRFAQFDVVGPTIALATLGSQRSSPVSVRRPVRFLLLNAAGEAATRPRPHIASVVKSPTAISAPA